MHLCMSVCVCLLLFTTLVRIVHDSQHFEGRRMQMHMARRGAFVTSCWAAAMLSCMESPGEAATQGRAQRASSGFASPPVVMRQRRGGGRCRCPNMLLEYAGEVASLDENLALLRLGQKQAEVGGVAGADWLARLTDQEMLRLCRARRRNVYGHEWKLQGSDGKSAVRVPRFCTGSGCQAIL